MIRPFGNRLRAVTLLVVLWGVAFLAGITILATLRIDEFMTGESRAEKAFRARQLALRGIALGSNPYILAGDPLLSHGNREDANSEGFFVEIKDDSGRINPNTWVQEADRELFRTLFANWGADLMQVDAATDSLADWVDIDSLRSLAGAELPEYITAGLPGLPRNAPIADIDEMASILNLRDLLAVRPGWRDAFTLWHDGPVNINHASADLLADLAGLTGAQIAELDEFRAGFDGILGTEDDGVFGEVDEAVAVAGASGPQVIAMERFFGTEGSVRRVSSTGFAGGVRRRIEAVLDEGGTLLAWEER
jgi:hypothetical protein